MARKIYATSQDDFDKQAAALEDQGYSVVSTTTRGAENQTMYQKGSDRVILVG